MKNKKLIKRLLAQIKLIQRKLNILDGDASYKLDKISNLAGNIDNRLDELRKEKKQSETAEVEFELSANGKVSLLLENANFENISTCNHFLEVRNIDNIIGSCKAGINPSKIKRIFIEMQEPK